MKKTDRLIASQLLNCRAVKLSPDAPFQWSSGWKSPIYCDNRITLSYPEARNQIKYSFVRLIKENFLSTEVIAAVATGAIAHGALVADELDLPFVYVRPEPKAHGLENQIEGVIKPGQNIVVIEDLISTGRSSLKAVEAIRAAGGVVSGMVAIFTYGFKKTTDRFIQAGCKFYTLSNFEALMNEALETGYIHRNQLALLQQWMLDPESWMQK